MVPVVGDSLSVWLLLRLHHEGVVVMNTLVKKVTEIVLPILITLPDPLKGQQEQGCL